MSYEGIRDGERAEIAMPVGPLTVTWIAEHRDYLPPASPGEACAFTDIQVQGPFASWRHTHRMQPEGPSCSTLRDEIVYALPASRLAQPLGGWLAEGELDRVFSYRHRVTRNDLAAHARAGLDPLTIAVTGGTGLIGRQLIAFLIGGGHRVVQLVRDRTTAPPPWYASHLRFAFWDIERGHVDTAALEGLDAVIHLAGESVFAPRWTPMKKRAILESRAKGTRLLAQALANLDQPPSVLLSSSATGIYGHRADRVMTESDEAGAGFLADVCKVWEAATDPASEAGIRTVHLRTGVVLDPRGGALGLMKRPFAAGLGGWLGRGNTYTPWIALDDVLYAMLFLLASDELAGPINLTAPQPLPFKDLAKRLGRVLGRPVLLRIPRLAATRLGGEAIENIALTSQRAVPRRLLDHGYSFAYPALDAALCHTLGKTLDVKALMQA
ncbi:MAG: TIGR01777 family oxidoreductase [Bacteroidota bacterium]